MISHHYKCLFVHVRKTGGGSILKSFSGDADETFDSGYCSNGTLDRDWDSTKFGDYLVFAVARNPWSRFISGLQWLRRRSYNSSGNLGPDYYCRNTIKTILRELPELLPVQSHDRRHLLWSHQDMLVDEDGRFVADVVLRFETLERDYQALCQRIGKPCGPLPHENRGSGRPYWEYYDDETRELVGDLFHKDIEYFGYRFGESDTDDTIF